MTMQPGKAPGEPDLSIAPLGEARVPTLQFWGFAVLAPALLLLAARDLRPNDLAGVAALLIPPAVALALGAGARRRRSWFWWLFAGLALFLLLETRSRGGLLNLAVVAATWTVLHLVWTRRRVLLALLASTAGLALLVLPLTRRWLLLPWLEGVQGLSWNSLLTGRPAIWYRATQAALDFSLTGLRDFGMHAPRLYPWPGDAAHLPVEDAHNLALQLVLDFGVVGLLAATLLLLGGLQRLLRVRRLARAAENRPLRLWTEALLASLVGHLVYGLHDVLAPGTWGFLAPLLILVLAWTVPGEQPRSASSRQLSGQQRSHRPLFAVAALLALVVGGWAHLDLERQRLQLRVVETLAGGASPTPTGQLEARLAEGASPLACRAWWFRGLLVSSRQASEARPTRGRDEAWTRVAACAPSLVPLLPAASDGSLQLARRIYRRASGLPTAELELWLAQALDARGEKPAAAYRYRRALRLRPGDGDAWLRLAVLLRESDPISALDAYARACHLGDPRANACAGGADLAQHLGLPAMARQLRANSRWPPARTPEGPGGGRL